LELLGKLNLIATFFSFAAQPLFGSDYSLTNREFLGKRIRIPFHGTLNQSQLAPDQVTQKFQNLSHLNELELIWTDANESGTFMRSGRFYYEGQALCGYGLKLTGFHLADSPSLAKSLILGLVPENMDKIRLIESREVDPTKLVLSFFRQNFSKDFETLDVVDSCLFKNGESLIPAKVVWASIGSSAFKFWVSEESILKVERLAYFAEIEVFPNNIFETQPEMFEVPTIGDGYLTSNLFDVNTHSEPRAYEKSNVFRYSLDDPRFQEASIFTHASHAWDFFTSLGFKGEYVGPVRLNINVLVNGTKNNAIYEPGKLGSKSPPTISVGTGDGKTLSNLATDGDVVTHELAHHLIYRKLTSTVGESLVLHEGLADFLTFAKSGDACLGESICPSDSNVCQLRGQCLRSGENDLVYKSNEYLSMSPHQKSQVLSGLLWDLHKQHHLSLQSLSKVLVKAVDFLREDSDILDFIYAFAMADQLLNQGVMACQLKSVSEARGLLPNPLEIDCKDPSTWPKIEEKKEPEAIKIMIGDGSRDASPVTQAPKKKAGIGFCSLVSSSKSNFAVYWLLILPIFIGRRKSFW
jgi:hypothetical protein